MGEFLNSYYTSNRKCLSFPPFLFIKQNSETVATKHFVLACEQVLREEEGRGEGARAYSDVS